jgi:ABC-2 type transport system permease protein
MLDAISAEALKFRRHRATWGLVWIWPIGVVLLWLLSIAIDLAKGGPGGHGDADAAS